MIEAARAATADDLPALIDLAAAALDELAAQERGGRLFTSREARAKPDQAALSELLARHDVAVLSGTVDEVVVGYAVVRVERLRTGEVIGVLDDLFVDEGARGVAVGEALMVEVLAWCRARKCTGVDAFALPGLRDTKNFFEASGFSARLLVMHHRFDRGAP